MLLSGTVRRSSLPLSQLYGPIDDSYRNARVWRFVSLAEPTLLDRPKIQEAFRLMGQYLLDRKALGEIVVYGGSAILLQFDWRRLSMDVDARIVSAASHGLVIEAMHDAAKRLQLPSSWLNESVTMYARRGEESADRVFIGTYPSAGRVGLRVMAAKPEYILAMKLAALERATGDDRDYLDAINLGAVCGVTTAEGLRDIFRKYFAEATLPFRAELRLRDLADAIKAKLS